jgi:hypothetical protein
LVKLEMRQGRWAFAAPPTRMQSIPEATMPLLLQVNGGPDRTRIHTLAMGDDADTTQLEAIAKRFGGTFTKVSAAGPGMPAMPLRP